MEIFSRLTLDRMMKWSLVVARLSEILLLKLCVNLSHSQPRDCHHRDNLDSIVDISLRLKE